MRRGVIGSSALGALLVGMIVVYAASGAALPGAAQDEADPPAATATRAAEETELADLQTQVAELSTEVARLTGPAKRCRVASAAPRGGFGEEYGEPVTFVGADQVIYDVPDVGRVTATFADGLASNSSSSRPGRRTSRLRRPTRPTGPRSGARDRAPLRPGRRHLRRGAAGRPSRHWS